MKVFYWTKPYPGETSRFMQINADENWATDVPTSSIGPDMILAMLDDGFTEISSSTAYKLGMPV